MSKSEKSFSRAKRVQPSGKSEALRRSVAIQVEKSHEEGAEHLKSDSSEEDGQSVNKEGSSKGSRLIWLSKDRGKRLEEESEDDSSDEQLDEDGSENSEADEDEEKTGMARLIAALGEDGLDDFDRAQLQTLNGADEDATQDEEESGNEGMENAHGDDQRERGDEQQAASDGDETEVLQDAAALDEVFSVDEDAVPMQKPKVEIDNTLALARIRTSIELGADMPWTETLSILYPETISADLDVNDDLKRELAFYKHALHSTATARALAQTHALPFTRPPDFFAEMVKSDSHMERIRQRLLDETAGMKRSDEKRREREGKKFGKQVQVEKLKDREKGRKEMDERVKGLKRKRKDILNNAETTNANVEDAFDIAVEDAIADRPSKRAKTSKRPGGESKSGGAKLPRQARDKKYGFGAAGGKRAKQNTKESTDSFVGGGGGRGGSGGARGGRTGKRGRGGSGRGGREGGGSKRLGKSRRDTARHKT